ncbi:hypothetical protein B2M20_17685 [Nitrobacter vulgaris]|uniref:Uncharacterized protein n=1 Tax=Nitrobacter vulgaris TaxID=29421 RepID=A0A1V4HUA4_NITVU|nr:hypothetical protein B2M20_17685 [Nitrobacter vulgaris]
MIEDQLPQGAARQSDHSGNRYQHGSEEAQKKNRGRTTTAAAAANSISTTLFGGVINMGVTAIASRSVLLCLIAAKQLI